MNKAVPNIAPLFDLSSLNLTDFSDSFFSDQQTANSDDEKFIVFFLDGELFAVSAEQVTEVVRPLAVTLLPNSPPWLCGIANLRGEIISILNLSKICNKKSAPVSSKSKLIVLKPKNFASPVAFPVDRLSELITLPKEAIEPAEDFCFSGKALHESNFVHLLDTEKLFSSLLHNS
ncbi:MAG: chemotaxis protein CheW [Actinomycetota bacterium]